MQKLKQENLIQLVDLYEGESTFYSILEYLAGESLHEMLRKRQTILEHPQIQMFMKLLLQALANMHLQNIMLKQLNQFDALKIVDFGPTAFQIQNYIFFPELQDKWLEKWLIQEIQNKNMI